MENVFMAICAAFTAGTINLSDNAAFACFKKEPPQVTKAGTSFVKRGVGYEFNVIIDNADKFEVKLNLSAGEELAQATTE